MATIPLGSPRRCSFFLLRDQLRLIRRDSPEPRELGFSDLARDIPLVEQQLDQLDEQLGFAGIDICDDLDALLHVGADIADRADVIDRLDRIGRTPAGACPLFTRSRSSLISSTSRDFDIPQKSRIIPCMHRRNRVADALGLSLVWRRPSIAVAKRLRDVTR